MSEMSIQEWEDELEYLGPWASFEQLVSHLEKGDRRAPHFQLLSDYVASMDANVNGGRK